MDTGKMTVQQMKDKLEELYDLQESDEHPRAKAKKIRDEIADLETALAERLR